MSADGAGGRGADGQPDGRRGAGRRRGASGEQPQNPRQRRVPGRRSTAPGGRSADAPPARQAKPAQLKPAQPKPAQAKPPQRKPAQRKPAQRKPAQLKPAQLKPAQPKPVPAEPVSPEPALPEFAIPEFEVEVGPVAHRGACVARHEGRVIFVRHALPGERVRVRVTDASRDRYWRADAVEVLRPSPDRVERPCPYAGPGRCGGCDWQHAALPAQRRLKAQVVTETLRRLAGLDVAVEVEPLPAPAGGADDGLGWRTRMRFAVTPEGVVGLRAHRSHRVVPTPDCRIAHPLVVSAVAALGAGGGAEGRGSADAGLAGAEALEVVATPPAGTAVISTEPGRWRAAVLAGAAGGAAGGTGGGAGGPSGSAGEPVEVSEVVETVFGRRFRLDPGAFWQVHPAAAETLVRAVLDALAPAPGETAVDLYAGAGLFAAFLAEAVGPDGRVVALESDPAAVASAVRSLADLPQVTVRPTRVTPASVRALPGRRRRDHGFSAPPEADQGGSGRRRRDHGFSAPEDGPASSDRLGRLDLAVLDPPRSGAGPAVMAELLAHRPRRVAYVACDPAALGRDLAAAAEAGYRLTGLRAFDLFPMTFHVECVATLEPVPSGAEAPRPDSSG